MTAATTLAALSARFDFTVPVRIAADPITQSAAARFQADFPAVASLMTVRISAESSAQAQSGAQLVAKRLAEEKNIDNVFVPGVGPFYDRFGILYLAPADIGARVERVKQLEPLFQAIAASPNLAGLSTLVNEIAEAVQKGRSPRGLEGLFLQMSGTIKNQVLGKPVPLDWQRVAGLRVESKSRDWVVVVHPVHGRLAEARGAIESIVKSLAESRPELKISSEFPPEARGDDPASNGRQVIISLLLSCLFFLPILLTTLRNTRAIVLFCVPPVAAAAAAFAAASLLAPVADQAIATFAVASTMPVMGFSVLMVAALARQGQAGASPPLIMLAAHETGPLILTLFAMTAVTWLVWTIMGMASMATLAVIVAFGATAGLAATFLLVPVFAALLPQPPDGPPPDLFERATARNLEQIWQKLRPPVTALLVAASLFCVVFFSSLHFSTSNMPKAGDDAFGASRGLQFTVEGRAAAEQLVADLRRIPEVGTVRWMGTFLPQQAEQKYGILQGLIGAIPGINDGSAVGPYDLLENLRGLETGLRVISDGAGTDQGLRASAHEFRRSLAVLTNTARDLEPAAVELERLLFSGFGELAKSANALARLKEPELSDLDPNLRELYVAGSDKWRIEALPRRMISAAAFINAVRGVNALPLGPLMTEQAELRTLKSTFRAALGFGFIFALLLTLAYLRGFLYWLIVVASQLLLLPLYAALVVTTGTAISPATIPAFVMASLFGVSMALLIVVQRWRPQITALTIYLPALATVAIVLPVRLLRLPELEEFVSALTMLLAGAAIFNAAAVPQICAWADGWRSSRPRQNEARIAPQAREDLRDDIF